jgi:uncharacterized membrane protein YfcA
MVVGALGVVGRSPAMVVYALEMVICAPATVNCALATVNCALATLNCALATVNCAPGMVICACGFFSSYVCAIVAHLIPGPVAADGAVHGSAPAKPSGDQLFTTTIDLRI